MNFEDIIKMKPSEVEDLVQSGMFNTIIQGYCIMAMKQAGFTQDEIDRLDFVYLFDSISAWEARRAANDE